MNKICKNGFIPAKDVRYAGTFSNVRKIAFTLAEVLVTLAIIGVVSAMTVPTLMQNHQRKTYVTQLHKVYNELSQALIQYQNDKNAVNLFEAGLNRTTDSNYNFIKSYFKITADCGDDFTPCMAESYKKLDGTIIKSLSTVTGGSHKCVTVASGASICVYKVIGNILIQIAADINGQKGPNIAGRDLFIMYVYNNGVIDDLVTKCNNDNTNCGVWDGTASSPTSEQREEMFEIACKEGSTKVNYHGCFGKILNDNWEMTY